MKEQEEVHCRSWRPLVAEEAEGVDRCCLLPLQSLETRQLGILHHIVKIFELSSASPGPG